MPTTCEPWPGKRKAVAIAESDLGDVGVRDRGGLPEHGGGVGAVVGTGAAVVGPLHERGAPGEAAPEGRQHEVVARPQLLLPVVEAERDRGGGGVAVAAH